MEIKFYFLIISFCFGIHNASGTSIGSKIAAWIPSFNANPDEFANDVRGDVPLADEYGSGSSINKWPDNKIPYVITEFFSDIDNQLIMQAINEFHHTTCVRFVPRTVEPIYINITSRYSQCFSKIGFSGMSYHVNLEIPRCLQRGVILHELAHAIGLHHEHIRQDRDNYVKINWKNIIKGFTSEFRILPYLNKQPYNYDSIMHYSAYAFSKNGQPTLEPKARGHMNLGQRQTLSQGDIFNINDMYRCPLRPLSNEKMPGAEKIFSDHVIHKEENSYTIPRRKKRELWLPEIPEMIQGLAPSIIVPKSFSRSIHIGLNPSTPADSAIKRDPHSRSIRYNNAHPSPNYRYYPQSNSVPTHPRSRYRPQFTYQIGDILVNSLYDA